MKRWIVTALLLATGGLIGAVYMFFANPNPDWNCSTTAGLGVWSDDHTYKATTLKKDCNHEETFFYSVKIERATTSEERGWFMIVEVESDPVTGPIPPPALRWSGHQLEITVEATSLSGMIEHREGDLTVIRKYVSAISKTN